MILINKFISKYQKAPIAMRASFWFAISLIIVKAVNFLSMPIFTSVLSVEEYGILNYWLSLESVVLIFSSLYLFYNAYVSGVHKYEDDANNYTKVLLVITTFSTIIVFLIYIIFQSYIDSKTNLTLPQMLLMFVDLLFTPAYQFWAAKNRYDYKYKSVVIVSINLCVVTLLANLIAVNIFEDKLNAKLFSSVLVNVIFGLFFYIKIVMDAKDGNKNSALEYVKFALKFSIPLIPHFLATFILNLSDRMMISSIVGDKEAGLYSVAYSISTLMIFVNTAINQALPGWFYRAMDKKKFEQIYLVFLSLLIFIAFINILVVIVAPELICIFSNENYIKSIDVIPPITASTYFIFVVDFIANFEYYFAETQNTKWISILPAIINIGLNFVFIKYIGFVAAGYTTLASYMIFAFLRFLNVKKIISKHKINYKIIDSRTIIIISLIFLLLCFLIYNIYIYTYLRYIILLIAIVIVFAMFYIAIKKLNIFERIN